MTTPENNPGTTTGRLEKRLDGIQDALTLLEALVKSHAEQVADLADTTNTIYDTISYHREAQTFGHSIDYGDEEDAEN